MSFLPEPSALITQLFPKEPYNFDKSPDGSPTGPLRAIFTATALRVAQFEADVLLLKAQVTVQEAAGAYLDLHGALYGIPRLQKPTRELDGPYRQRILAGTYKLTIPAIQKAVVNFYASTRPNRPAPIVNVYDIQSNPTLSALYGLVMFQFMVDVSFPVPISYAFFCDRTHLGYRGYLMPDPNVASDEPSDPALVAELKKVRAADTEPVFRTHSYFVPRE